MSNAETTMRLKGKVAFITGAGQGVGAAIAEAFVDEGAAVCIAEPNPETGATMRNVLRRRGGVAMALTCDVANRKSLEHAMAEVIRIFGRIDISVNSVGVNIFHDPLKMSQEEWRRRMLSNLEGALLVSRAALPSMRWRQKGVVINIASMHGLSIIPGCSLYPVAKHALLGLTKSLAIEFATEGVRINTIVPDYIDGPIAEQLYSPGRGAGRGCHDSRSPGIR